MGNENKSLVPIFSEIKGHDRDPKSFETIFRLDLGDSNIVVFAFASVQQQNRYISALETLAEHFYLKSVTEITFAQYELIFFTGNVTDLNRRVCVVQADKGINWNSYLLHHANMEGVQKIYEDLRSLGISLPARLPSIFRN